MEDSRLRLFKFLMNHWYVNELQNHNCMFTIIIFLSRLKSLITVGNGLVMTVAGIHSVSRYVEDEKKIIIYKMSQNCFNEFIYN